MHTLFIVGPTATGKTDLALSLVPKVLHIPGVTGVDILSADSKQVYIGEDIVTGKDQKKLNIAVEKFEGKLRIFGIDVVKPSEEWSVSHFLNYTQSVFSRAQNEKRFVIVVGGTGQYLSSLLSPPQTAFIPRSETVRQELETLSLDALQRRLKDSDPDKWESMNMSDRSNPRRLVRAIEVAISGHRHVSNDRQKQGESSLSGDALWIGLRATKDLLEKRIQKRVKERIAAGAIEETRQLLVAYPTWTKEAHSAIGYGEIESFLEGKSSIEDSAALWSLHEVQYAKRQTQWFRRQKNIVWFDCDDVNMKTKVAKGVMDWYTGHQIGGVYGDNQD